MAELNRWFEQKKGVADFRAVYISEAHPSDGRQVRANERDRVIVKTHTSMTERVAAAKKLRDDLGLKLPILVDTLDDSVSKAYQAWPDRIYIIGGDGKIAYQGKPGPRGFDVAEARLALDKLPVQ